MGSGRGRSRRANATRLQQPAVVAGEPLDISELLKFYKEVSGGYVRVDEDPRDRLWPVLSQMRLKIQLGMILKLQAQSHEDLTRDTGEEGMIVGIHSPATLFVEWSDGERSDVHLYENFLICHPRPGVNRVEF